MRQAIPWTRCLLRCEAPGLEDKDLQTVNFSIYPIYSQERSITGEREVTGYRVANFVNGPGEAPSTG